MASAPSPIPDVGTDSSPGTSDGSDLDQALRGAVLTLESAEYQDGNPAFSPLGTRDWVIITAVYVLIPVVLALVVGTA